MDAGGDGRGWARMGVGDGRGWIRMLMLVIIALSEKKRKKKTYLMNGASAWLSVDVQGGGSGR